MKLFKTKDVLEILGISRSLFIEMTRKSIKGKPVKLVVTLFGKGQGSQRLIGVIEIETLRSAVHLHRLGVPVPRIGKILSGESNEAKSKSRKTCT